MKIFWTKNTDDAWEGRCGTVLVGGIVKRVLPTGRHFVAHAYNFSALTLHHKLVGIFKDIKDARQAVKETHAAG